MRLAIAALLVAIAVPAYAQDAPPPAAAQAATAELIAAVESATPVGSAEYGGAVTLMTEDCAIPCSVERSDWMRLWSLRWPDWPAVTGACGSDSG